MSLLTNLQGYWKVDESSGNAADSSGNNNTLTNVGSATYGVAVINNGAILTGRSKYLSIANASQTGLGFSNDFSIGFWLKLANEVPLNDSYGLFNKGNSGTNNWSYILKYEDNVTQKSLRLQYSQDGVDGGVGFSARFNISALGTSVFHYILMTVISSTKTVVCYLDGSSVSLTTPSGTGTSIFNSTAPFDIGAGNAESSNVDGTMDEIGAWSRALTSTEDTQLYNSGAGLSYPFTTGSSGFFLFMPR